ncbi:hypothetical protein MMC20_003435 [Loxospora ochrophaea]|nr:hypothetical protein [Loxospora ochrophaea]
MAQKVPWPRGLRFPSYDFRSCKGYHHFLKAVFTYNNQNKAIMNKPVIDRTFREGLSRTDCPKKSKLLQEPDRLSKSELQRYFRSKRTPDQDDGANVRLPNKRRSDIERLSYFRFASMYLPRENLDERLTRGIVDGKWKAFILQCVTLDHARAKYTTEALDQSKTRKADSFWKDIRDAVGAHDEDAFSVLGKELLEVSGELKKNYCS